MSQNLRFCLPELRLCRFAFPDALHFDNYPAIHKFKSKIGPPAFLRDLGSDVVAGAKTVKRRSVACRILVSDFVAAVQDFVNAVEREFPLNREITSRF